MKTHFEMRNEARRTMVQLAGAAVLLLGAYQAWQQLQQQGEIGRQALDDARRVARFTDQREIGRTITEATGRLDAASVFTRLAGIYSLGRVAMDGGPGDKALIAQVLCSFIRERARWKPGKTEPNDSAWDPTVGRSLVAPAPTEIQAALDVLRNEEWPVKLNLAYCDLAGADLSGLHAPRARLDGVHLERAVLARANLEGAVLRNGHLRAAFLGAANLALADLSDADLSEADLENARLASAIFWDARLNKAHLRDADASYGHFDGADLTDASFYEANLAGAYLLHTKGLSAKALEDARLSAKTFLPKELQHLLPTRPPAATPSPPH